MSTWTLEKIKNCEEIKFGTFFLTDSQDVPEKSTIIFKWDNGAFKWIDYDSCCDGYDIEAINKYAKEFHFYRPDGSEILPPEDEVKFPPLSDVEMDLSARVAALEKQMFYLMSGKSLNE
jgi:hypothetical protein